MIYYFPACMKRICFIISICILPVLVLNGCDIGNSLSDEEHISRAREYQNQGNLSSAVIELKNALKQAPGKPEARWMLGKIYLDMGAGAAAEKELNKALELGIAEQAVTIPMMRALLLQGKIDEVLNTSPEIDGLPADEQAEIWSLYGHANFASGSLEQAEKAYEIALDTNLDDPGAGLGKAQLAIANNKLDEARDWLNKVLESSPDYAAAWSLLGDLERSQEKLQAAEDAYGKAIASTHDSNKYLLKRALVRIDRNEFDGAKADIDSIRSTAVNFPGANLAEGLLALRQEHYVEAHAMFEKVQQSDAGNKQVLFYLGITHFAQEHWAQAEDYLRRYLAFAPHSDTARKRLAMLLLKKQDYDGAAAILEPLVASKPDDPEVLNLLAYASQMRGETQEALEQLAKLRSLQPDSAFTQATLGLGFLRMGKREEGIDALERATELDPQLIQADVYLVMSYIRAGDYDKALDVVSKVREKQPDSTLHYNLLGMVELSRGNKSAARDAYNAALKLSPGDPSAAVNLADMELEKGNIDSARDYYKQVLAKHPSHLGVLLRVAALETGRGDIEAANAYLKQALSKHPDAIMPRIQLARNHLASGRPMQALELAREVRKEHPDNPQVLLIIGEADLASNNTTEAIEVLEKLVSLKPDSLQAYQKLANAYERKGDFQKTKEMVIKALALDPDNLTTNLWLVRVYVKENKAEEAAGHLGFLKKKYPEHPEILAQEGWFAMQQGKPEAAVIAYKKVMGLAPNSRIVIDLSRAQYQAGDLDAANATLRSWLDHHPHDTKVRFHLANRLLALDRNEDARIEFGRILEELPNDVLVLNNLAWLYRNEDLDQAVEYAQRAMEIAPGAPAVQDTMGMLLLQKGELEKAERLLRQASERVPYDLDKQYHMALVLSRTGETVEALQILQRILNTGKSFDEQEAARSLYNKLGAGS